MTDLEALKKDFADLDWTAAKAENARLRERERALIDELAEANAAHDDAETRADAALLDLRIANEALATFNARVLRLEAMERVEKALAMTAARLDGIDAEVSPRVANEILRSITKYIDAALKAAKGDE